MFRSPSEQTGSTLSRLFSASGSGLQLSCRRRVPPDQVAKIKSRDLSVFHDPASADHDAVGAMRAAEDQRVQRIAAAGKTRFIELEQRKIGHLASRDLADIR